MYSFPQQRQQVSSGQQGLDTLKQHPDMQLNAWHRDTNSAPMRADFLQHNMGRGSFFQQYGGGFQNGPTVLPNASEFTQYRQQQMNQQQMYPQQQMGGMVPQQQVPGMPWWAHGQPLPMPNLNGQPYPGMRIGPGNGKPGANRLGGLYGNGSMPTNYQTLPFQPKQPAGNRFSPATTYAIPRY